MRTPRNCCSGVVQWSARRGGRVDKDPNSTRSRPAVLYAGLAHLVLVPCVVQVMQVQAARRVAVEPRARLGEATPLLPRCPQSLAPHLTSLPGSWELGAGSLELGAGSSVGGGPPHRNRALPLSTCKPQGARSRDPMSNVQCAGPAGSRAVGRAGQARASGMRGVCKLQAAASCCKLCVPLPLSLSLSLSLSRRALCARAPVRHGTVSLRLANAHAPRSFILFNVRARVPVPA